MQSARSSLLTAKGYLEIKIHAMPLKKRTVSKREYYPQLFHLICFYFSLGTLRITIDGQRGMKQGELTSKRTQWIKSNLFLFNFKFLSKATWHSFKLALCKCHIIRLLSPCRVAMLSTCHARMLAERTIILADKSIKIVTNLRII